MSHKARKELEEARKAGLLPPEQDAAGNLINPHIPEFMAKAPWYLNQAGPGLQHQRKAGAGGEPRGELDSAAFTRGTLTGAPSATVFRPGACRNCGAMTHAARDCVERPRARGAWKTGQDIAPDELLPSAPAALAAGVLAGAAATARDFDAKRDRYTGYDPAEHSATVARFAAAEEARKRKKEEDRAAAAAAAAAAEAERRAARAAKRDARGDDASTASEAESSASGGEGGASGGARRRVSVDPATAALAAAADSDDEFAAAAAAAATAASDDDDDGVRQSDTAQVVSTAALAAARGGAGGSGASAGVIQPKMGVRNLRVREDRAKYLLNLDVDSAYYDPKTRSMREDPFADSAGHAGTAGSGAGAAYHGDLAWRNSGDHIELMQAQLFAWEAAEKSGTSAAELNLQANPTQMELLRKQFAVRKAAADAEQRARVLERYGGAEHMAAPPPELLLGQGEAYVEYGRDGLPLPSREAVAAAAAAKAAAAASGVPLSGPSAADARSRYTEDSCPGNHTAIWGSWWNRETRAWGFACCHSTHYMSYCTGTAGREAQRQEAAARRAVGSAADSAADAAASAVQAPPPPKRARADER